MTQEGLVGIGAFSLLSGLSIAALRHYDEIDLLRPADVDARTNYRRYDPNQVVTARTIRALRAVDVPIEDVVIALKSPAGLREVLQRHRERLAHRANDLREMLSKVEEMIEKGVVMPDVKGARIAEISLLVGDLERSRAFYESVFDVRFGEDKHDGPVHYHASFGAWPTDNFFLFTLWPAGDRGATESHFGFMVDDLDAVWKRAQSAGAKEFWPPRDSDAMPRNAKFADPDGNEIFLYEA